MNNKNNNFTTSGSKRGRPKGSKANKETFNNLKVQYKKELEPELIQKLKENGLYEVFCDALTALAFKGFSLDESYKALYLLYKHVMSEYNLNSFLSAVFQDEGLRNSYFSYSSNSIQGFLIKILKNESKINPSTATELLKISYSQQLPELSEEVKSEQFSKKTTSTLERILEGLESLGE